MQDIVHPKGKVYYSMGEVAEMFDVNPSLLRYWEREFDVLKPHRNKKGNRLFTPQDVDNLKVIYHLLKEKKMKIEVARKYLRDNKNDADRDAMIVERLMSIRSTLMQIKQDMLHGAADDEEEDAIPEEAAEAQAGATAEKNVGTDKTAWHGRPVKTAAPGVSDAPDGTDGKGAKAHDAADKAADTVETELTITEILAEETGAGKLPFREQMLFEVALPEAEPPSLDSMIDSFMSKNYNPGLFDPQPLEHDPFAAFADRNTAAENASGDADKPKPAVIEQTLF